jgi:DNA-binding MarR family transcriptional regulator
VRTAYLDAVKLVERMHRQFLEVVKTELDRLGIKDINNVQSLILFNIGEDELTVGELTNRGYYLGSNVSYNVRKMVEAGYLVQERSPHDRRSIRVRLSEKGLQLGRQMTAMFDRHAAGFARDPAVSVKLNDASGVFRNLERYWSEMLDFGGRFRPADMEDET